MRKAQQLGWQASTIDARRVSSSAVRGQHAALRADVAFPLSLRAGR